MEYLILMAAIVFGLLVFCLSGQKGLSGGT